MLGLFLNELWHRWVYRIGQRINRFCFHHEHQSMETQGRTFAYVNICSCSINHWASQVEAQASTWHVKVCLPRWFGNLACDHFFSFRWGPRRELLDVLSGYKKGLSWTIADIKGISLSMVMPQIHLEENAKNSREPQRRLDPVLKEVVRAEVMKLLDAGIVYPISDSQWVSSVQVVSGVIVVVNENNELVLTRFQTGWRVWIDCRKLNSITRKDHFPLPIID